MLIDLSLLGIIILSGIGLVAVVGRKLTIISSVDVQNIPERKATELKEQLLEQRFSRNLREAARLVRVVIRPLQRLIRRQFERLLASLKNLEQRYSLPAAATDATKAKTSELLNQARAYVEDEQLPQAEQKCIEAIGLNQREVSAYRLLGDVYRRQKEYDHAREVYEFLLKLNVQDPEAYVGLGRIAADVGQFDAAAADFTKSLELSDTAAVHLELSEVYQKIGSGEKALAACQDALALDPRNPKLLDRVLTLALELRRRDVAEDAFAALKAVNPENQKLPQFSSLLEQIDSQR